MTQVAEEIEQKGQVKSKKRIADHGEVFTAEREVNAMLDMVKQETERIDSKFLEPACGDGNFLAEVLKRKLAVVESRYGKSQLEFERYLVIAVSSIYGVDILEDNAIESSQIINLLQEENIEITVAYKGEQALEYLSNQTSG